jgi:hypothetical protein
MLSFAYRGIKTWELHYFYDKKSKRFHSILHDIVDFHAQMGYGSFQIPKGEVTLGVVVI